MWVTVFLLLEDWCMCACVYVCVRVHVGDCISAVGRLVYVCVCVCVCVHVGDCISAVGRLVYVCMCMFTGDYFCCWNICIIP